MPRKSPRRAKQPRRAAVPKAMRPDWPSFFALQVDVPEDFLADRDDSPPQSRDRLKVEAWP